MNHAIGLSVADSTAKLPLKGVRVDACIRDLFCDVTVEQRYENTESKPIEAVYTFALPLDAVLLDVEVMLADRNLRGTIVPKAEAEEKYERAMVNGDAAIRLELLEPGLYGMSLGNLLAGESATISFRYGQLLRWNGDAIRFHIPTTIAPRYGEPQVAPHHVPPMDLLAENRFTLGVQIAGLLAGAAIDCPTHRLTTRQDKGAVKLELASGESFMDRDVVLNLRLAEGAHSSAVCVAHAQGRVALLSWRPAFPATDIVAPRTCKIVVDCSGSMNGDSIVQARLALARIVESLRSQDRFDIIRFGSTSESLFGAMRFAKDADRERALEFASSMQADLGGTEIGGALHAAYRIKGADQDMRPDLLLITDGQVSETVSVLEAAQASGHRIFTVGVGASVAEAFVRRLAEETGGACELVSPNENMADRIFRHFQRMRATRAKGVRIQWPGTLLHEVPSRIDAVYDGDTVHAFAWLSGETADEARVQLTLEDGRVVNEVFHCEPIDAGQVFDSGHPVARVAAAAWIAEAPDNAQHIAIEYQLLTDRTDFLIVHQRAELMKATELPALRPIKHMVAAGWGGIGSVGQSLRVMADDMHYTYCRSESAISGQLDLPVANEFDFGPNEPGLINGMLRVLESELVLDVMTNRLRVCTLQMLGRAKVPIGLTQPVSKLVEQGNDEYQVVLAFLVELANLPSGFQFSREAKRIIAKAAVGMRLTAGIQLQIKETVASYMRGDIYMDEAIQNLNRRTLRT